MSTFRKIIDNPYLAPVMTPLKWIGTCVATTTGPYVSAAQNYKNNPSTENPFLKYAGHVADEVEGLIVFPVIFGALGGLVGGIALSVKLLAAASLPLKIVGGLAVTSAVTATSIAVAPVVLAVGIAAATLVAATSVATVPGILVGFKKTADHIFSRKQAMVASAPAPSAPVPAATTLQQLTAHLSGLPEAQQRQILDTLQNKASNDFAIGAAAAAGIDKDIAISKTIQLKKPRAQA